MDTISWTPPLRLLVALLLGILIGLERESARDPKQVFAGIRTYALVSLLGFGCAWLYQVGVSLALPVGMVAIAALIGLEYAAKQQTGRTGWTSEVATLLTFVIGALALLTDVWVPMALGVVATLLLAEKVEISHYVERLEKSEFLAVVKFLLVTVIILPALPNQQFTRFELNPVRIWEIVILVSSIGFIGYFLSKRYGEKVGMRLSGILGGIVSSTAVTIALGRIAQRSPEHEESALQATILASSVMYIRILALIWILNPAFVASLWWKLIALSVVGLVLSIQKTGKKTDSVETPFSSMSNPFEIKPAVIFAILFVLLSVMTTLVRDAFGNAGLLTLSSLVGVTDIDPFILSLIRGNGHLNGLIVASILLAMMSNTIVKGLYFGVLVKGIRRTAALRFAVWAALHIPLIIFF